MSSAPKKTLGQFLAVLAGGALFGFGLALSTMVRPEVVLSFLRFQDFGLMLVMGGAVVVTLLAYLLLPRMLVQPLLGGYFHQHVAHWNRDTLVGSALFGVGWGLCGVCPGPAIAGLGTGNWSLLWALAGIALGALVQGLRAKA
ncbi:MAG: YeeE/YedE thiosulfate transporter family protein [Rhodoferax sp.]|nr:YeeE/YedE thiosulfate transporter family protein [Rhodoferax sp.]